MSPWWNSKERWEHELGIKPEPQPLPLWKFAVAAPFLAVAAVGLLASSLVGRVIR